MQNLTQIIHLLANSYPSFRPNSDILRLYEAKLARYPIQDVADACNKIIETNKFFPTLSELIGLVKSMAYNKDIRYPERYRKAVKHEYTAFDDASIAMMKAKGYKTVDDFTRSDVEELLKAVV